jgi:hypothetical protein
MRSPPATRFERIAQMRTESWRKDDIFVPTAHVARRRGGRNTTQGVAS